MSKHTIYIFATALLLLSCSKTVLEQEGELLPNTPQYEASTTPVGFGTDSNWSILQSPQGECATKDGEPEDPFREGNIMGVFGYYRANGADIENLPPNFMYNQQVEHTATPWEWDYSPKKYWSNNDSDLFDFYAYYPYNELLNNYLSNQIITLSGSSQVGLPTIYYTTPQSSFGRKVDVLYAAATGKSKTTDETVSFAFKHLLAKVQFKIAVPNPANPSAANDGTYKVLVSSIGFNIPESGEFNFAETNEKLPVWSSLAQTAFFKNTISGAGYLASKSEAELAEDFTQYILPTTITSLTIHLSTDLQTYSDATVDLTANPINIEAGKITTINLNINIKGITATAQAQPWTETETITPEFTPDK